MLVYGQIDQGVELTVLVESHHTPTNAPSTSQPPPSTPSMQTTYDAEEHAIFPYDLSHPKVQSLGSDEGSLTLNELKLIMKVNKLVHKIKTSHHRRRARVVISNDEEDLEDLFKQGRKITEIDENPSISLVQDEGTLWIQKDYEIQGRTSADTEILLDQEEPNELVEDLGSGENNEKEISTANIPVSTAGTELSTVIPEKKTNKQLEQEILRHEEAIRLQEQINEEERQRITRDAEIAKQLQEAVAEADPAYDIDWNDPVVLRYHAFQNRSFSVAEVRKNMCMYLKNQGGYKQSHFKGMSYEDVRLKFERVWDQNHAFVPMDSKIEKE
nr:hypothetical protein [Tanacetum cinerariifolium]